MGAKITKYYIYINYYYYYTCLTALFPDNLGEPVLER